MTWNYRLCKETYNKATPDEELSYTIREVYYNKAGNIWGVTETAASVFGETAKDAQKCAELMQLAFQKEIIDLDAFVFSNPDFDEEPL